MPGAGNGRSYCLAASMDTRSSDRLRPRTLGARAQRPQLTVRLGGAEPRTALHPSLVGALSYLQRTGRRYCAAGADGGLEIARDQDQARYLHHHLDHLLRELIGSIGRKLLLAARLSGGRMLAHHRHAAASHEQRTGAGLARVPTLRRTGLGPSSALGTGFLAAVSAIRRTSLADTERYAQRRIGNERHDEPRRHNPVGAIG